MTTRPGQGARWHSEEARRWVHKGRLAHKLSDHQAVDECFATGLEHARQSKDRPVLAQAVSRVRKMEGRRRQYDRARSHFLEAARIDHELGDMRLFRVGITDLGLIARGAGINRALLGDLALRRGDLAEAVLHLTRRPSCSSNARQFIVDR